MRATPPAADVERLLDAAVGALGGEPRPGQLAMVRAVQSAIASGRHLLVQAGTGTGKSLGYLVPALSRALVHGEPVVVSTATLALQAQVVDRDLPRLADAVAPLIGRRPTFGLVKGRRNYLCRQKLSGGFPDEDDALFALPVGDAEDHRAPGPAPGAPGWSSATAAVGSFSASRLGRDVVRLREWAEQSATGDRDELVPGVSERAWRQVSVSAHECLGAQRCSMADECFSEQARAHARDVDVVVTNHAFLAIDAFEGRQMLPEHSVVVVDEGHELADRVTSVVSAELTPVMVQIAARRARSSGATDTERLDKAAEDLAAALTDLPPGRFADGLPEGLRLAVGAVRDAARSLASALKDDSGFAGGSSSTRGAADGADGSRQLARASVSEVFDVTDRLVTGGAADVLWLSAPDRGAPGASPAAPVLHVAPLSVAEMLRQRLFNDRTVVLTSATLNLGGSFDPIARQLGLAADEGRTAAVPAWTGLDAGSPFDYPRQAILYVARHLPPPGRDGIGAAQLDELAVLVEAAGGRTLGLFSSRRAAEAAAAAMRERLDVPVLCQGEDQTATLVRAFARDAATCLFGTLSLWQGVDVPGPACQLVVVDRIPFPRPDDPLMSARQRAVNDAGGNGFMSVAATHAGLRLAQGVGRLVRSGADRGVVAVLDPRLATARYAGFLRASLPPFWTTTDRDVALKALRRIDSAAGDPWPVAEPTSRAASAMPASPSSPALPPSAPSSRTTVVGGRAWTQDEDSGLRASVAAGRSLAVIAGRYECTPEQAAARIEGLDLELPVDELPGVDVP